MKELVHVLQEGTDRTACGLHRDGWLKPKIGTAATCPHCKVARGPAQTFLTTYGT